MAKWDLFAPVRITDAGNNFDPFFIENGLGIGLFPQVVLDRYNSGLAEDFVSYLNLKKSEGLEMPVAVHPRSDLLHHSQALHDLELCIGVNNGCGRRVISEVIFHPGRILSAKDEANLRNIYGFGKGVCFFSEKDFNDRVEIAAESYSRLQQIGFDNGIDVLAENMPVLDFEEWSGASEGMPAGFERDVRWGKYFSGSQVCVGLVGISDDLLSIIGSEGKVCIDVEHLGQAADYLANNYKFAESDSKLTIKKYSYPLWVGKNPFCQYSFIDSLASRISFAHLAGYVSDFYEDDGVKKVNSHMPITFPGDPNKFIVNDKLREEQNALRKEKLTKDVTALYAAGCRKFVIEVHVGPYSGSLWHKYMEISKRNIESVLSKLH